MSLGKARTTTVPLNNPQSHLDGIVEKQPVITQETQRKAIVDTGYTSVSNLIVHTTGDDWVVNYYRQLVGLDDPLSPLQKGKLAVNQQYELVERYELKVDSPLSQQQDTETKEFEVIGSGAITYGLIPNVGDMFVADIGNGTEGLFCITQSTRLSYTKQSAYEIAYILVAEYDATWQEALEGKVIKEVIFEKKMLEEEESPFMTRSAHIAYVALAISKERMSKHLMNMFWAKSVQSIKLPLPLYDYYDGWHADFCIFIGLGDIRKSIDTYQYGLTDLSDVVTIWDLFKDMDVYQLPLVTRNFGELSVKVFNGVPVQRGIAWSPFDKAIYPKDEFYDIDMAAKTCTLSVDLTDLVPVKGPTALTEALQEEYGLSDRPMYYPVSFEPYILSTAFYDGVMEDMSVLEYCLYKAIKGEAVSSTLVSALCSEIYTEPHLSQYYYIPMLLTLISVCRHKE